MMVPLALAMTVSAADAPACRFMARPARTGEAIAAEDTVAGACSAVGPLRKLRYDRVAKVARAAVDLAPGDELGRVFLPVRPRVLPGERVAVVAQLGPVRVSREVTAAQPGHSGRWLFVRDDAGKVFRAPMPQREQRP